MTKMGLEQRNIQHPESTEFPKTRAILTTDGRIVTDRMTNALNAPLFTSDPFIKCSIIHLRPVHDPFTNDLTTFVAQLRIRSRTKPVKAAGDPKVNGYNVWPTGAQTFVPGNSKYGGFRCTWQGEATPVEMLSCSSSTGDWLHVELWRLEGGALLVKMFTDWN
jgi:hypothetical protein